MAQTWDDLLFAHWRVDAAELRALVPEGVEVDEFDGSAWLGIVPFELTNLRARGTLPLPRMSGFRELNVRTCVTHDGKPGIWFFSLDASSRLAVEAARALYRLPYFHAHITLEHRGGSIVFESARDEGKAFSASYAPRGDASPARPGSLAHFLTERYCLYTEHDGAIHRADIHHRPWPLQPAQAALDINTMPPDALELQGDPVLHFSRRQDALIWPLERA